MHTLQGSKKIRTNLNKSHINHCMIIKVADILTYRTLITVITLITFKLVSR